MTGMEGAVERVEHLDSSGSFPKLRDSDVCAVIARESYHVDGALTICILTTINGFRVTGESSCVDPRNFDAAKGRFYAKQKAKDKLWELEGYLLKQKIFEESQFPARR